jgi:hypothetical protein
MGFPLSPAGRGEGEGQRRPTLAPALSRPGGRGSECQAAAFPAASSRFNSGTQEPQPVPQRRDS